MLLGIESGDNYQYLNLGPLVWLALLEGARSEEQGEMAAAWMWYRTVLRMRVHVMRRGSVYQRFFADRLSSGLQSRIASWAADRRTDGALLRRALEEVRAFEPKPEWDSFSLKVDYLIMMNELDSPNAWIHQGDDEDNLERSSIKNNGIVVPYQELKYSSGVHQQL